MKTLINVFHPELDTSAVNATWVETLRQADDITLNLQYTNYPDWLFDIQREQALLVAHDLIVLQCPFLWYSVPPLLKKWFDDVLTYGWAYGTDGNALKGKAAVLATSTGCSKASYSHEGENNCSMSELLKPIQQTLVLTQVAYKAPFIFHSAVGAHQRDIDQSASHYLSHIEALKSELKRD